MMITTCNSEFIFFCSLKYLSSGGNNKNIKKCMWNIARIKLSHSCYYKSIRWVSRKSLQSPEIIWTVYIGNSFICGSSVLRAIDSHARRTFKQSGHDNVNDQFLLLKLFTTITNFWRFVLSKRIPCTTLAAMYNSDHSAAPMNQELCLVQSRYIS